MHIYTLLWSINHKLYIALHCAWVIGFFACIVGEQILTNLRRSNVWHGINFLNSCRGLLHPRLLQWWQWTLLYCGSLNTLQSPSLSVPVLTRKRPLCLECTFICCSLSLSVHVCALEFLTHPLLSQGGHCPTQSYIGGAHNVRQAHFSDC